MLIKKSQTAESLCDRNAIQPTNLMMQQKNYAIEVRNAQGGTNCG